MPPGGASLSNRQSFARVRCSGSIAKWATNIDTLVRQPLELSTFEGGSRLGDLELIDLQRLLARSG
jgi:hypothetical protein